MNLPRLTYFDMRGRAEAIRLFLHADPRVPIAADIMFPNPWSDPIALTEVARGQRRLTPA